MKRRELRKRLLTFAGVLIGAFVLSPVASAALTWSGGTGLVTATAHPSNDFLVQTSEATTISPAHVQPGESFSIQIVTRWEDIELHPTNPCSPDTTENSIRPLTAWSLYRVTPGGPSVYDFFSLPAGSGFLATVTGTFARRQYHTCDPSSSHDDTTLTLTVPAGLPAGCYQTTGVNAVIYEWSGAVATLTVGNADCGALPQCDFRVLFVDHSGSIPGVHLFDFDTLVRYEVCSDGSVVFLSGDGTSTIDFGVTTFLLENLGFTFITGGVTVGGDTNPSPAIAQVPVSGKFAVQFDWAGQVGQRLGGKLNEKLEAKLLKELQKVPRAQWMSIILGDVEDTISKMLKNADKIDQLLIDAGVPRFIAEAFEDAIEEPLQLALAGWRLAIQQIDLRGMAVDQVVGLVEQKFQGIVLKPLEFPVWLPTVVHTLTSTSADGFDNGWHNPFLAITRTRNQVVS